MHPGLVLDGRFILERMVGEGGMGTVWRARDVQSGDAAAVKVLHRLDSDERFAREVEILLSLRHPGLAAYLAHGRDRDGRAYLAMQWVDGDTLAAQLAGEPLRFEEVARLGARLAATLGALHRAGVVHRDVKPGNVILPGGDPARAVLVDLGLARLTGAARQTRTGAVLGTPGYLAPEQARGEVAGAAADVFALGCLLYEAIAGASPFAADSMAAALARVLFEQARPLAEVAPETPPGLAAVIARMLAAAALDRPSVDDVGAALAEVELAGGGARRNAGSPSIGDDEQVLIGVVVAVPGLSTPVEPAAGSGGDTVMLSPGPVVGAELVSAAARLGGRLEQLGDGTLVMALRGSGAATDLAARIARAAMLLRDRWPEARLAAALGRGLHRAGSSAGDALDRALALRSEPGAIRLDPGLAALLEGGFVIGRDGDAVRLLAAAGDERAPVRGRVSPFVGRDRELALLLALYDEVAGEPVARAAMVLGPAGIGKSRLRRELERRLGARAVPPRMLVARGDSLAAGAPFALLAQLVRAALGVSSGEELGAALAARVGAEAPRLADFLGEIVGAVTAEPGPALIAARRSPALMRDQIERAWLDLLAATLATGPVLLVIEDLHWGDLPSVQMVDAALRVLAEQPLLVVALARPEVHDLFPQLWGERAVQTVRLGPLTRRAAERMAGQLLDDPSAAAEVVAAAAGNPILLEELVRARVDGRHDAGTSAVALVQARLEALARPLRRILRAASVFGESFVAGGVAALTGLPAAEVIAAVDELVLAEVVVRADGGRAGGPECFAFRHALVRDAAYAMLPAAARQDGHRAAATWLLATGEPDPALVAEHLDRGGAAAEAAVHHLRAAHVALDGFDLGAALQHAACARAAGDPETLVQACTAEAAALRLRGELTAAAAAAAEALRLTAPGSVAWYDALGELVQTRGALGEPAELRALIAEVQRPPADRAAAASRTAAAAQLVMHVVTVLGDLDAGEALLLQSGGAGDDPHLAMLLAQARGDLAMTRGDLGLALSWTREVLASALAVGDRHMACRTRINAGFMLGQLGDHAGAEAELRTGLEEARRASMPRYAAGAHHNLGDVLRRLGRPAEARAAEEEAIAVFARIGDRRLLGSSRVYLAEVLADQGDLDGAIAACREAVVELADVPPSRVQALGTLAHLLLGAGATGEALAAAREAVDLIEQMGGTDEGEARARLSLAEALAAAGDQPAARAAAARAAARLHERAAAISDPVLRASFLSAVAENALTLALPGAVP